MVGRISRNVYIHAKNGHWITHVRTADAAGVERQKMEWPSIGRNLVTLSSERLSAIASSRLAWWLGAAFALTTVTMAAVRYAGLNTTFYDLGVFEHFAFRALNGDWSVLTAAWSEPIPYTHVQPIFLLHALLYAVLPSPLTLIVVQACTLALAFPLLERIAVRLTQPPLPQAVLIALALSGPLWFQAMFDFHTDHVAIPGALLAMLGILEQRQGRALIGLTLVAATKENFLITAALLAMVGAVRNRSWVLAAAGAVFFGTGAWVILQHLPAVTPVGAPALPAFNHLGTSGTEILGALFRDPSTVFSSIDVSKLRYLLMLVGPTLGLAILGWEFLLPAGFTLGFVLLSTNPSHSCTCTQYTAGVIPYVMVAAILGFRRTQTFLQQAPWVQRGLPGILVAASALAFIADSPSPVSRQFLLNKGRYGHAMYAAGWRLSDADAAAASIPGDVPVAIQNSVNASSLVRRAAVVPFPTGLYEAAPFSGLRVQYAVIDTTRDKFVVDRVDAMVYDRYVQRLRSTAVRVASAGTLEVYRIP